MGSVVANRIPETRFSTDQLETKERFPVWRESISVLFDVNLRKHQDNDRAFAASVHSFLLGPLMLATCRTRGHVWERSAAQHMRDGIDHYLVQLFEHGQCRVDDTDEIAGPGDILILDAGQDMKTETKDFQNLSLIVPRPLMAEHLAAPDEHGSRVVSGKTPLAALLADHLRSLRDHAAYMTVSEANAIVTPSILLAAQMLNNTMPRQPDMVNAVQHSQLNQVKKMIERRLAEVDLKPDVLAKSIGLSRSRLYRLFEPLGGVAGYIRERRLSRAMSDLVQPGNQLLRVADIAYRWGFSSEADFSRAFKRRFGLSPSAARNEDLTSLQLGTGQIGAEIVERHYEEWLRGLARV